MELIADLLRLIARMLWWRAQEVVIDKTAGHLQKAADNGPGEWQMALDERLRENPIVDPLEEVRPTPGDRARRR